MKQTNKTVFAFVFAATAIFLMGVGGTSPHTAANTTVDAPLALTKSAPAKLPWIAPAKGRDLIA